MSGYSLTPEAIQDLEGIWLYIARNNPEAADALEDSIHLACERLVESPLLGHARCDLTERRVRFWLVKRNYLIVYNPASTPLKVLRVLHGARNAAVLLGDV